MLISGMDAARARLFGYIADAGAAPRSQPPLASAAKPESATVVELLQPRLSVLRLEKHLDDYRKGRAYLSKDTAARLRGEHFRNGWGLGSAQPGAGASYGAYASGFKYEHKARFIAGVHQALRTYQALSGAAGNSFQSTATVLA